MVSLFVVGIIAISIIVIVFNKRDAQNSASEDRVKELFNLIGRGQTAEILALTSPEAMPFYRDPRIVEEASHSFRGGGIDIMEVSIKGSHRSAVNYHSVMAVLYVMEDRTVTERPVLVILDPNLLLVEIR